MPLITTTSVVSESDWMKGIGLSVAASIIGSASKLAIRKSWIMVQQQQPELPEQSSNYYEPAPTTNVTMAMDKFVQSRSSSRSSSSGSSPETVEEFMGTASNRRDEQGRTTTNSSSSSSSNDNNNNNNTLTLVNEEEVVTLPSLSTTVTTGTRRRVSPVVVAGRSGYYDNNGTISTIHSKNGNRPVTNYNYSNNNHNNDHQQVHSLFATTTTTTIAATDMLTKRAKPRCQRNIASALGLRYCGMLGMTVFNPICCVLAMQYASPSILAPFSGLTLVWIVLFSEFSIGERPQYRQIVAAGYIVAGEVIVAVFGDHTNETGAVESLQNIYASYTSIGFLLYAILLSLWMMWNTSIMLQSSSRTITTHSPPSRHLIRFSWGVAGGSITGLQNFLKDALTIHTMKPLPSIFYLFAICAALTSFGGLLLLTACMKRYDATYSSSMFVGSFVLSASFMSAVRYHTFQHLDSVWNYVLYPTGLLILLFGIYMLATVTLDGDDDDNTDTVLVVTGTLMPRRKSSFDEMATVSLVDGLIQEDGDFVR
jgi:drug/metabolite transporter (DMT)-like permease